MATNTTNQPIDFIVQQPMYVKQSVATDGYISEAWRQFFQTLWNRTGGNTNQIINVNDLITNDNGSDTSSQQIAMLAARIALLEVNDGFSLALQALETAKNSSSSEDPMAYDCLGVM